MKQMFHSNSISVIMPGDMKQMFHSNSISVIMPGDMKQMFHSNSRYMPNQCYNAWGFQSGLNEASVAL